MKKYVLDFICKLEGFKTAIKQLHWDANSLSQHQLCDDIATTISDYQDKVSEVEQSISGKLPVNNLKGTAYNITTLKKFVEDVIKETKSFYSKLKKEGDGYIGMRSDTEAVLSDLQRQLYLVNFTIKESLKERLRDKINENRVTISNGREQYSLTENELREYVSKAIRNVKTKINEIGDTPKGQYLLGQVYARANENKQYANMKKRVVRLSEGDLHRIVKKSVNRILQESYEDDEKYFTSFMSPEEFRERTEQDMYNFYGNQSQYPAYEYLPPFEGELGMTAQYNDEDRDRRMSDYDPEYFLDGRDDIYRSKMPGNYSTNESRIIRRRRMR